MNSLLSGGLPWPQRLTTLAAFLVFALALVAPSGYSYGAVLLLIGAIVAAPIWLRRPQDKRTLVLVVLMLGMAVLWRLIADPNESVGGQWDRALKFLFAVPCLLFVAVCPPRARAIYWGLLIGCIGTGLVALWQVYVEASPRASGFPTNRTNAIQWGNLAVLLAAMLAVQTLALRKQLSAGVLALATLGVIGACNASVLSQSRGGWLALLLAAPLGLLLLQRLSRLRLGPAFAGLGLLLVLVSVANLNVLSNRWELLENEVQVYDDHGNADSSIGQRLEHWRFAWNEGRKHPILGLGMDGYLAQKKAGVESGAYHRSIDEYIYAHNEMLDLFVKTGLAGMLLVLCFYAWPIYLFWPSRERMARHASDPPHQAQVLALRLAGLAIPVLYIGFGLTQVFFAHNSGIMAYLFFTMLCWAALRDMDHRVALPAA